MNRCGKLRACVRYGGQCQCSIQDFGRIAVSLQQLRILPLASACAYHTTTPSISRWYIVEKFDVVNLSVGVSRFSFNFLMIM